jgi:hypothetical protein
MWFHVRRTSGGSKFKVVSSLDVTDIAIGPKIDENGQRRVSSADGNPDFDLSTDLDQKPVLDQQVERRPKEEKSPWASWTGRWRS